MFSPTTRTWLWQLSYAILGLCFFVGLFMAAMTWTTHGFWKWAAFSIGSVIVLAVLGRTLHRPPVRGRCPKCGYDHAGLEKATRCPECGTEIVVVPAEAPAKR